MSRHASTLLAPALQEFVIHLRGGGTKAHASRRDADQLGGDQSRMRVGDRLRPTRTAARRTSEVSRLADTNGGHGKSSAGRAAQSGPRLTSFTKAELSSYSRMRPSTMIWSTGRCRIGTSLATGWPWSVTSSAFPAAALRRSAEASCFSLQLLLAP